MVIEDDVEVYGCDSVTFANPSDMALQ